MLVYKGEALVLFKRRLLPQICIARNMYSTLGKCVSLLWQIFLMFGPSYVAMRAICNRVGGLTSDLGTEKRISNYRDILIPFLKMLHVPVPKDAKPQRYLFPHSILSAGWYHLWDGVIRFGLCMLPWFKVFLRSLKALTKYLRENITDVIEVFRAAGLEGAANFLEVVSLPVFLEWRWGPLMKYADQWQGVFQFYALTRIYSLEPWHDSRKEPRRN